MSNLLITSPPLDEREPKNAGMVRETGRDRPAWFATCLFVIGPIAAAAYAAVHWWNNGVSALDLVLVACFYVVTAHGITVGFHRLLTHRSFNARRPLKIALAIAGSMAFQGGPIDWVGTHRRHHSFSDRAGDPHSPNLAPEGASRTRAFLHSHMGWLFSPTGTAAERRPADLLADPDIVRIDQLFPLWCGLSLALPFAAGYLVGGGFGAAFSALLWAGGVRIFLGQHVTWAINSVCHRWGRRPFSTRDNSGNVAALAIFSMGESWHNNHHAHPRSARHGLLPHQWDSSAGLIRLCERLGWAHDVVWSRPPDPSATVTPPSEQASAR